MNRVSFLGKIAQWLAVILICAIFMLQITGNQHLFKALGNTYLKGRSGPSIDEHEIFENRLVKKGDFVEITENITSEYPVDRDLMTQIEQYNPTALLIYRNNDLVFEHYWEGYGMESRTNSFSMAKSIIGLSIGIAIDRGMINSLEDKVVKYIPELQGEFKEQLRLKHLLTMTSGMNFDESYGDPFGFMAKAYYGDDLLQKTLSYSATTKPGTEWKYLGGNTILLSIILSRVSGKNVSEFVSEYLWKPLGSSDDAIWNIDQDGGIEKSYCCFYARARDFARLGLLIQNKGVWNDTRIISQDFLQQIQKPVVLNDGQEIQYYGRHWWLINYKGEDIVYARGILGQYIIILPKSEMVIVRLGKQRGEKDQFNHPADLYHYIDLALGI